MYITICSKWPESKSIGPSSKSTKDASKQTDPCSGEDCTDDTTQDSLGINLTKLDIGEGEAHETDELIVEVAVDNLQEEGHEEEVTVSNEDKEYNVTLEC